MDTTARQPQEWTLDIETRLRRLRVSKLQLAKSLGLNYTIVCNASTGYINRPEVVGAIFAKIEELESKERGRVNV